MPCWCAEGDEGFEELQRLKAGGEEELPGGGTSGTVKLLRSTAGDEELTGGLPLARRTGGGAEELLQRRGWLVVTVSARLEAVAARSCRQSSSRVIEGCDAPSKRARSDEARGHEEETLVAGRAVVTSAGADAASSRRATAMARLGASGGGTLRLPQALWRREWRASCASIRGGAARAVTRGEL